MTALMLFDKKVSLKLETFKFLLTNIQLNDRMNCEKNNKQGVVYV